MAGQSAYAVDIVEKLRCMFLDGKLPVECDCARCHVATDNVLGCTIECERTMIQGPGFWKSFFTTLFVPFFIWKHVEEQFRNPEVLGSERVVRAPIRLCETCAAETNSHQREMVKLLQRTLLYDQLLREYPSAQITFSQRP